jgi:hypothetical protein
MEISTRVFRKSRRPRRVGTSLLMISDSTPAHMPSFGKGMVIKTDHIECLEPPMPLNILLAPLIFSGNLKLLTICSILLQWEIFDFLFRVMASSPMVISTNPASGY